MDKLISTAKVVDTIFRVISILLKILFVTALVCTGIILVGVIFDLPAEMIGTGFEVITMGDFTFHVAEGYVPALDKILLQTGIILAIGAVVAWLGILSVKAVRAMLAPMKEGQPFHSEVSANLRKLGVLSAVIGVAANAMKAIALFSTAALCDIGSLLTSEKITHVGINVDFDLTFLVLTAVLFLLAYIFRYGAELQQLSDETL